MVALNFNLLAVVVDEIRQRNLSGCLTAASNQQTINSYFADGNLHHSELLPEGLEGDEVLYTMASWRAGSLQWGWAGSPSLKTIDEHQALAFYEILNMLQKRDQFLKPGLYKIDPAFFAPEVPETGFSSAFWQKILNSHYRPYKELAATKTNFEGILRAFATSKRTGIIRVEYNGIEIYYLIEAGTSLGAFNLHSTTSDFRPVRGPILPLFDLPGSCMDVFLVPPTANLPAKPNETERAVVETVTGQLSYNENNPYDF